MDANSTSTCEYKTGVPIEVVCEPGNMFVQFLSERNGPIPAQLWPFVHDRKDEGSALLQCCRNMRQTRCAGLMGSDSPEVRLILSLGSK